MSYLMPRSVEESSKLTPSLLVRPDLKDLNIIKLSAGCFQTIYKAVESQWRELAALVDNSRYQLSKDEVESCVQPLMYNLLASPAENLLMKFSNKNMTVKELVILLDHLHIETALTLLCQPVPLSIVDQPVSNIVLREGDQLVLSCRATGFPYPHYTWFKEQQQIPSFNDEPVLIVNNISRIAAGRYVCRIHQTNHVTQKTTCLFTTHTDVTVEPRPFSAHNQSQFINTDGCAPVFTQQPESQSVHKGDAVLLSCLAVGLPAPQYYWVKNGVLIPGNNTPQLTLCNIDLDNAGEYYCIAKNIVAETCSQTAVITVTPEMYSKVADKPRLLRQPVDQSHGIGGEAVFSVDVDYSGKVTYQWFHDEQHIPGAVSSELRFKVEGFYNKGCYVCHISTADKQQILSRQAELKVTTGPLVYTAADKLAIFIGVSTYKTHGVPLPAVEHDLEASVRVFESLQFKVISLLDLTLNEMNAAVKLFCSLLSSDVYVVFYCAGHGFVGPDGHHYLVPWDAHHDTDPNESLCIETVEDAIQRTQPKLLMFFLDICRKRLTNVDSPPRSFTRAEAVPNKIILYAASEGQQAYEESKKCSSVPRGLFNQYLLDVINKPMHAFELYYAVMDKFKACPYDRKKFPQFPALLTNNEDYRRTLHDPIDNKTHHNLISQRLKFLQTIHNMPGATVVRLYDGTSVRIAFERVTSNVLDVVAVPVIAGRQHVAVHLLLDSVPAAVRPHSSDRQRSEAGQYRFRFYNLQRLTGSLIVDMYFVITSDLQPPMQTKAIAVDLQRPLISALPQLVDQSAPSAPPTQQRKQPREHIEDQSLQSDSG